MLKLRELSSSLYHFKLKEVLKICSNPVSVIPDQMYTQIGIRSHGKGIFIKDEVTGAELGNKRVFWVEPDCFIVNIVFAWERAVARTTSDLKGFIASHRFPMYKVDPLKVDLDYFTRLFLTKKGKSLLELASPGGAGRNKTLGQKEFLNLEIQLPSLEIQKYISTFLIKLDKKIQLQQEKIDLLKAQKKGFMQKIFSQELRFKNEDGQEFPEWQSQLLGTLGNFGTSYSYSRAFEGKGSIQHIHYGDIHSNLPTVCEQVQFPSITEQREFEFVKEGDILFADASEDYNDLGKAILIKSLQSPNTVAGLHTHKFAPNEFVYPLYLIYITQTKAYREFIKKMGTGVSVLGISKTNLVKFETLLPSLDEQKKIGEFLFSFDKKIEALNKQKDYLIQQKQAFMQQMFI